MSATPLPALPPTPATPPASAPRASTHAQQGGASFTTHLQSAQQQQQPAPDASQQDKDTAHEGNSTQDTTAQAGSAPAGTAAKPGDSAASNKAEQGDATDNDNSGIDLTGGAGTLASVVLSLIDHVSGGDTHASGNATKPTTQATTKAAVPAQPALPAAGMIPVPPPPPLLTAASPAPAANAKTNASSGSQPTASANTLGNALSSSVFAGANADSAVSSDTGNVALASNAGPSAPSVTDGGVQAFAATLAAVGHADTPSASAIATDNTSPAAPDLSALGSLTATAPAVPASATSSSAHTLAMDAPVGSSGFAKELSQHVTWLSGQDIKQAQIRLNPQDLGPLDVKVSVEHGRVDVAFMTQHPATTAAVQQGLDQLHQMLGGQGLSLGHATVGQHAQQQFGTQHGQQGQASSSGNAGEDVAESPVALAARVAVGLVDAFA